MMPMSGVVAVAAKKMQSSIHDADMTGIFL
jgi:hypothetical protein